MGCCRNSPEVLFWKQPGSECTVQPDLCDGCGFVESVVSVLQAKGLVCAVHVHAANTMPCFPAGKCQQGLWGLLLLEQQPLSSPRSCRWTFTTCGLVLGQLLACRKKDEKSEAFPAIDVPFILKYVSVNTAFAPFVSFCKAPFQTGRATLQTKENVALLVLGWFAMSHSKLSQTKLVQPAQNLGYHQREVMLWFLRD